jgi:predicted glutamine amidotransferase
MCQLSLVATRDVIINRTVMYHLLIGNCIGNRDGTGIYNPKISYIFKTKEAADTIKDKLSIELSNQDSEVLLGHVRAASWIDNKKEVSDDKAHPFKSTNFTLFHNGGLEKKSKIYVKEDKDLIDSEVFLKELEYTFQREKDPVKCISKTMDKFQGKFAFLIEHKGTIYIVRGKTAELHICKVIFNGEIIGCVINTNEITAKKSLDELTPLYNLWRLNLSFSKFEKLADESIYILKNDGVFGIEKKGDIKETPKPITIEYSNNYYNAWNNTTELAGVVNMMITMGLSFEEMDKIFSATMGVGILQCTSNLDVKGMYPVLEALQNRFIAFPTSKKYWEEIKKETCLSAIDVYNEYGIQFPYFLDMNLKKIHHKILADLGIGGKNVSVM